MIWRQNLHQSTSLSEAQKALEAHGCKLSVTNFLIALHTCYLLLHSPQMLLTVLFYLEIINESQVNMHVV